MASHKTSHHTSVNTVSGFTLIEIVTVIGIFTILMGATLIVGLSGFQEYSFHSDRDLLIAALHRARAEAVGNVCLGTACTDGKPHGVAILPDKYVIFQGTCYASPGCVRNPNDIAVDEPLDASSAVAHAGTVSEIVFTQLSGVAVSPVTSIVQPWTIRLTDTTGRTSLITIETEGRIWWTN